MSKYLLLLTAAPDAIVRVECTALVDEKNLIECIYFQQQHHSSIVEFLQHHMIEKPEDLGLFMQVSISCAFSMIFAAI